MQSITEIAIAMIVVVIGILIMSLLGNIKANENLQRSQQITYDAFFQNSVALYLKQPVMVDGENMTMADLMIIAYFNKGAEEDIWKKETDNFFRTLPINKAEIMIGDGPKYTLILHDTSIFHGLRNIVTLSSDQGGYATNINFPPGPIKIDIKIMYPMERHRAFLVVG